MLPSSHVVPINAGGPYPLHGPEILADAFSEFISASALLEASYRDLQQEVAHLGVELAERNSALTESLAENDRMRAALQQIIDSMPCGVLVLNTAEAIVMINPEGRTLLGLGSARICNLRELSGMSRIDFEALATGASEALDNEVCLSSSAGKRWLAIGRRDLSSPSTGRETGIAGMQLKSVWILRDITSSKQAELEREAARNSVALAETSMILAHEIRNPLASMELFAGLIAEDPEHTAQWISHLRAGIRQLSGTVNNVLSMQSGGDSHRAPVDLAACIEDGVAFVQPIAEQAGVTLSFVGEDRNVMVLANENGIRQIVLNLVSNAIRHTLGGGAISVAIRSGLREGVKRGLVEIADTGCGIPDHLLEQIFDAGYSSNGETPGLGLAVCRRLMHQFGGEIRVSSRAGSGTTFQLEFPTL
ncbi:MAG TPA: PAS domain-containing sensor histidine kinase [Acidobacteriaceae bacterium]|jgi:two-component system sensor histidine kinase FlrB|nr:PAS domain-containing sensor histidine kinase [Acidobacteriaceae bacterium]